MANGKKQLSFQLINLEQVVLIDLDEGSEEEGMMPATTDKWLAGEDVPEDAILATLLKYHRMVRGTIERSRWDQSPSFLCSRNIRIWRVCSFTSKLAEFGAAGKPNFLHWCIARLYGCQNQSNWPVLRNNLARYNLPAEDKSST